VIVTVAEPSGLNVKCSTLGVTVETVLPFALKVTRARGNTEISRMTFPSLSKKVVVLISPLTWPWIGNEHVSGPAGIVKTSSMGATECSGGTALATAARTSTARLTTETSSASLRMRLLSTPPEARRRM
jgi:hypothetical protein